MPEAIPFIKIVVLGDLEEEENLANRLKLESDRVSRIKLNVEGVDINVIFVFPDPRTRNEQFLEIYLIEADIIILCLSQKVFNEILKGNFVKLWKYPDKHYVILTSDEMDQISVFDELLNLGLKRITVKSISEIKSMNDLESIIREVIKRSLSDLVKSRKRTLLAGSLKFLDDEIVFKEEKEGLIKKILEDLL